MVFRPCSLELKATANRARHFSPPIVTKTSSDNTACHSSINQRLKARFTCTHARTLVGNTQLLDLPVYCVLCATETRSLGLVKSQVLFILSPTSVSP